MKKIYGSLIHGKWIKGSNFSNVFNPFNSKIISKVSINNIQETIEAIKSCQLAFKSWSKYRVKSGVVIYFFNSFNYIHFYNFFFWTVCMYQIFFIDANSDMTFPKN